MATPITFNGAAYNVPAYNDSGWAQGAGNLSSYLIAIASGTLQTTGGAFTLSADANFGVSYGVVLAYAKSASAAISTTGVLRLSSSDAVGWRNNANSADILLGKDTADRLKWGTSYIVTSASGAAPVENRQTNIAGTASGTYTGSLTVVNLAAAYVQNAKNLHVFLNGLLLAPTLDYAETSGTSYTLNSPATTGDRIDSVWTTY